MNRIDVGAVLSRVFSIYGSQFGLLFGLALVVNLVSSLLIVLVLSAGAGVLSLLLVTLIGLVLNGIYAGIVVKLVQDLEDGRRDSSVGDLVGAATAVLGPLLAVSVVVGVLTAIGFVLIIVPGLFALTIWAVAIPAAVVERNGVGASMSRSQELVRGDGWQVFGVIVVVFLLSLVVSAIAQGVGGDGGVAAFLLNWILPALLAPVSALVASVLYFSLRGSSASARETAAPVV